MSRWPGFLAACAIILGTVDAQAGLYYSGETFAELPSRWSGFLMDQRALRSIGVKPTGVVPRNLARLRYEKALARLESIRRSRTLNADELADLGALYIRLGESAKAVQLLRSASQTYPTHFHIVANLGTAWQIQGDFEQAAAMLEQAARLAPGKLVKAEQLQLRLVRLRRRLPRDANGWEDLLGYQPIGPTGVYQAGKLMAEEAKKLPSDGAATMQLLGLWLPADGNILWQLAELANAYGDVRTAAAILDGCVMELGMRSTELRRHRQILRDATDKLIQAARFPSSGTQDAHATDSLRARSRHPLGSTLTADEMPAISSTGATAIPWTVLTETTVGAQFPPAFGRYLLELDGKSVSLEGFMQPVGDAAGLHSFLFIEYPVGCWYCEMPPIKDIARVELLGDKSTILQRGLVKVTGKLKLNNTDPQGFLYVLVEAQLAEAD